MKTDLTTIKQLTERLNPIEQYISLPYIQNPGMLFDRDFSFLPDNWRKKWKTDSFA
ncbi:MAG: hypothetical protein ACLR7Z_21150 [Bilophila wadsworthia]|uniref:hypothetical protein n=1 Tax=Bilophila wadsworthia TaxID=35833 RepID=UPI0027B9AA6D|nr:hypothetical protein [Bilophila wadsworthia]